MSTDPHQPPAHPPSLSPAEIFAGAIYAQPGSPYPPGSDPLAGQPPFRDPMEEFRERLTLLTPHVYVTWILLAINVIVYGVMVSRGVNFIEPDAESLLQWGADFGPYTLAGEWWRMISCAFVHIGLFHIAMNMFCLAVAGPMIERMLGNIGFLVLYLIAALGGSLVSLWWNPMLISAGASGAVFGMYGVLFAIMLRQHGAIPPDALTQVRNSGLAFVGYNLFFGLTMANVDNAAHLGGLATGFLAGLVLAQPLTEESQAGRWIRDLAALVLGALAMVGGSLALQIAYEGVPTAWDAMKRFPDIETKCLAKANEVDAKLRIDKLSAVALADVVSQEILPEWSAVADEFEAASHKGLPARLRKKIPLYSEYARLRREQWELVVEAIRTNNSEKFTQSAARAQEANAAVERLNNVLREENEANRKR